MSVLLCGNPTLVESIFLGKRGGSQSKGHRDTCGSGAAATTDHSWTRLNTDPSTQMHAHTHTQTSTHTEESPLAFNLALPTFPVASPVHSVMCTLMRVICENEDSCVYKPCHQFVPVIKTGFDWPNCGQSCLPMVRKSTWYPFTRRVDDEVGVRCSAMEQWWWSIFFIYIYSTRGQKWPIWWRGEHIMHKWLTSLDSKVVFLNVNCNSCDPPWTMFYFSLHKPTQTCRPLLKTSILSDPAQHRAAAGLHSSDLHREVCWDKNFQVLWNKTPPAGPSTVTLQSEVIDSPNTLLFKHHISYAHKHVRMRRMCGGRPWVTATHAGKGGWRGGGAQFLGRCDGAA